MDSRERRGGSEHVVCSGSDRSCSDWVSRVRIGLKRLRSITPTKSSIDPRVVPNMVGIPDGRAERLVVVAHPALTQAIEAAMWKSIRSDPPPNTSPVVKFFLYKQSVDPARFDHYHPRVAAALAKIEARARRPRRRRRRLADRPTANARPAQHSPAGGPRASDPCCWQSAWAATHSGGGSMICW